MKSLHWLENLRSLMGNFIFDLFMEIFLTDDLLKTFFQSRSQRIPY